MFWLQNCVDTSDQYVLSVQPIPVGGHLGISVEAGKFNFTGSTLSFLPRFNEIPSIALKLDNTTKSLKSLKS